jgi:hypothetical protein
MQNLPLIDTVIEKGILRVHHVRVTTKIFQLLPVLGGFGKSGRASNS